MRDIIEDAARDTTDMGFSIDSDDCNCTTSVHVKKVAVIGAGVAGLQLAERLGKKSGLEVSRAIHTTPRMPTRAELTQCVCGCAGGRGAVTVTGLACGAR